LSFDSTLLFDKYITLVFVQVS